MKINIGESVAALAVVLFGGIIAYFGSRYAVGTIDRMGPGYFPVVLGIVTMIIGLATLLEVRKSDAPAPEVPWRAFFFVFAGVLAWALLAERAGLVPASLAVIVLASLARPPVKMTTMILTAILASAGAVLLFIHGFGLPLRAVAW